MGNAKFFWGEFRTIVGFSDIYGPRMLTGSGPLLVYKANCVRVLYNIQKGPGKEVRAEGGKKTLECSLGSCTHPMWNYSSHCVILALCGASVQIKLGLLISFKTWIIWKKEENLSSHQTQNGYL